MVGRGQNSCIYHCQGGCGYWVWVTCTCCPHWEECRVWHERGTLSLSPDVSIPEAVLMGTAARSQWGSVSYRNLENNSISRPWTWAEHVLLFYPFWRPEMAAVLGCSGFWPCFLLYFFLVQSCLEAVCEGMIETEACGQPVHPIYLNPANPY